MIVQHYWKWGRTFSLPCCLKDNTCILKQLKMLQKHTSTIRIWPTDFTLWLLICIQSFFCTSTVKKPFKEETRFCAWECTRHLILKIKNQDLGALSKHDLQDPFSVILVVVHIHCGIVRVLCYCCYFKVICTAGLLWMWTQQWLLVLHNAETSRRALKCGSKGCWHGSGCFLAGCAANVLTWHSQKNTIGL